MDTLKTGFIVVLLLAVLYGVYVVLNKDQSPPSAEIAWHQQQAEQDLQIDISSPTSDTKPGDPPGMIPAEPNLLATPDKAPAKLNADTVGMPAGVTAELSLPDKIPVEKIPVEKSPAAAAPAEIPSRPATLPAFAATAKGTTPPPQPALLPATRSETSASEVAAPSLLATRPAADAKTAEYPLNNKPGLSNGLTTLPSLREPATALPDQTPTADALPEQPAAEATAPQKPASALPGGPASSYAETAANQSPPQTSSSALDAAPTSAEPAAGAPSTPTPNPSIEPIVKPVSTAVAFEAAIREAQSNLSAEQWYQALFVLSKFYGSPDLSAQQERELIDLLDPLAAKVVYSQEHLVTDAHEVRRGDTLAQIAATNQVPPELLSNINGIQNPDLLVPGTKLKIVRGPFRAEINLQKKELTLFAGQLYAGRFPISVGRDPEPQPGEFRVVDKQPGHDFFSAAGQRLPANDPQNPYGKVWISLDKELAIHGTADQGESGGGCISLSPLDAADVYSILTQGSSVIIRR